MVLRVVVAIVALPIIRCYAIVLDVGTRCHGINVRDSQLSGDGSVGQRAASCGVDCRKAHLKRPRGLNCHYQYPTFPRS